MNISSKPTFSSFRYILRSEITGSCNNSVFNFLGSVIWLILDFGSSYLDMGPLIGFRFLPLVFSRRKLLDFILFILIFFLISWLENKWKCIPWEYILKWELRPTHSLCQEKCFIPNEEFCHKLRILVVFERTYSIKYKCKIL